mmetsp:Transcript_11694/g.25101  ORF Transcript_11694/g.25101 Transcript_11694/m.25101 type:complete len:317 (-) Transcript_11694:244-1194(-)
MTCAACCSRGGSPAPTRRPSPSSTSTRYLDSGLTRGTSASARRSSSGCTREVRRRSKLSSGSSSRRSSSSRSSRRSARCRRAAAAAARPPRSPCCAARSPPAAWRAAASSPSLGCLHSPVCSSLRSGIATLGCGSDRKTCRTSGRRPRSSTRSLTRGFASSTSRSASWPPRPTCSCTTTAAPTPCCSSSLSRSSSASKTSGIICSHESSRPRRAARRPAARCRRQIRRRRTAASGPEQKGSTSGSESARTTECFGCPPTERQALPWARRLPLLTSERTFATLADLLASALSTQRRILELAVCSSARMCAFVETAHN